MDRVVTVIAVVLRASCTLAGGAAAFAAAGPPVHLGVLAGAIAGCAVWSVIFARRALRAGEGLSYRLVGIDLALTAAACLAIRYLVPPEALPGECSWVAIMASTTVVIAQLGWQAAASVPAGVAIALTYAAGATLAGNTAEAIGHAITLVVQTLSVAALMLLVRRAGRGADDALAEYRAARRVAATEQARRAAERAHNRDLHDTVLSTLTMVGLGAVPVASTHLLRERARSDLATVTHHAMSATHDQDHPGVRLPLADRLAALADRVPRVSVLIRLADAGTGLSAPVVEALTESAAEALSNVDRHAGVRLAEITLTGTADRVIVEIADPGTGFDPGAVPPGRFGLRESVRGRMTDAGGAAEVFSAPGAGTRVTLRWPA